MIRHDIQQGSLDWVKLRMGRPTSSEFHKIITPKKGNLSEGWNKYAYRLIAEKLLNQPLQTLDGLHWVERGKELENAAVQQYQFVTETETEPVGFITTNDGLFGCSPDRLVISKAIGVEIKAPAAQTHIGYLLDGTDDKYKPQVQGQLLIAELEEVHLYSYHPRMPAALIHTYRDEPYIKLMRSALAQFHEGMEAMLERARASGIFQAYAEIKLPVEKEYDPDAIPGEKYVDAG